MLYVYESEKIVRDYSLIILNSSQSLASFTYDTQLFYSETKLS